MPWQKGRTGNPAGRPRKGLDLRAQVRVALAKRNPELLAKLLSIALDPHDDVKSRLGAIKLCYELQGLLDKLPDLPDGRSLKSVTYTWQDAA